MTDYLHDDDDENNQLALAIALSEQEECLYQLRQKRSRREAEHQQRLSEELARKLHEEETMIADQEYATAIYDSAKTT